MAQLGFEAHRKEVDALFDEWDDGSGLLDYQEINKKLRRGAGVELLPAHLREGAMGKIETKAKNKTSAKPRGKREGQALRFDIDEGPGALPVADQLRNALSKNGVRAIDMFRDWDDDGSGARPR